MNNDSHDDTDTTPQPKIAKRTLRGRLTTFALLPAMFLAPALTAEAALFTVDNTADNILLTACTAAPNDCSIGGAIANSNTNGQVNTIDFDPVVFAAPQTISLQNGFFMAPLSDVTINGPAVGVTISLATSPVLRRHFSISNDTAKLEINRITLTGGYHLVGGAIYSAGYVVVRNSVITGNDAANAGGGLANVGGYLEVTDSTVSGNALAIIAGGTHGGGIHNFDGTAVITRTVISGNSAGSGGGIYNRGALRLTDSTVRSNTAYDGGGIDTRYQFAPALIYTSTISGNTATGVGGGVHHAGFGELYLINSTVSGNSAATGGGLKGAIDSRTFGFNATFSHNSATGSGGGFHMDAATGFVTLSNSIVANSTSGGDCVGGRVVAVYSLIEDGLAGCVTVGSNNLEGDPMLGPLQNNGGPTQTHALLAGSKVIDRGRNASGPVDQRGFPRPFDDPGIVNAVDGSDMGAFEVGVRTSWSPLLLPTGPRTVYFTNATAGSPLSVSFSLGGYYGPAPFAQPPASQRIDCLYKFAVSGLTPISTPPGDPYFSANTASYTTVWLTSSSYAGTCRRLFLYFPNNVQQTYDYRFF